MNTPICDFVNAYVRRNSVRLHMPGHKGAALLGCEPYDLTEITGADSLYEADGIIRESENNASGLFGCPTFYSTEGSSQCIRAMMHLLMLYAKANGKKQLIAAARNVHKTFLTAAAFQDWETVWLWPDEQESYLSCTVRAEQLDQALQNMPEKPVAVYLTSPDYLGQQSDIRSISRVCRKHGVLLAVDNAHGAYLRFLSPSEHPMDLGADLCCDSAHKTLPALTGAAYLHIANDAPAWMKASAKVALSMYGSTSPSYLILQSLDRTNAYLDEGYPEKLKMISKAIDSLKTSLVQCGYELVGDEKLKITIDAKAYGYTGIDMAKKLENKEIFAEFFDEDYLVLMVTPENTADDLEKLQACLSDIPRKTSLCDFDPGVYRPERVLSVREAMMSPGEWIPVTQADGRILAAPSVGCPPAVPIIMCGERIDRMTVERFQRYGIERCMVVKND